MRTNSRSSMPDRQQIRKDAEDFLRTVDQTDTAQQWAIMFAERTLYILDDADALATALGHYAPYGQTARDALADRQLCYA